MIKHICSNCNSELTVSNMAIECGNCRAVIYTYPGVYMHVKVDMPLKAKPYEEVMLLHKQLAEMRARISEMEKQLDYYRKQYIPNTFGPNTLGPNMVDSNEWLFNDLSPVGVVSRGAYQKAAEQAMRALEDAIRNSTAADE